jgi:hypothetical protein
MDRYHTGGILELTGLIEDHRAALAADFRQQFGISIYEIGESVSYAEAVDLVRALSNDPQTHLFADLAGWQYPYSRTDLLLADLWDLLAKVNSADDDAPRHPRPYSDNPGTRKQLGDTGHRSEAEIKAKLRSMSRGSGGA